MIRRSTASRLGALGGSALMLAALGAPAVAQDVQTDGWGDIGDVTIRIAAENASVDSLTALSEAFMAEYPNVTIETEFKDWDSHIATMLNVADLPDAPDIIWGNQGYVHDGLLVEAGLITSLEPYYEAYGWDEWHGPGAMDQWRFTEDGTFGEGPRWGISESAEIVGVFYNKEKLANLGLEVPTTFAEFEERPRGCRRSGRAAHQAGQHRRLAGDARRQHRPGRVRGCRQPAGVGLRQGRRRLRRR